jgi:hypothetical protein
MNKKTFELCRNITGYILVIIYVPFLIMFLFMRDLGFYMNLIGEWFFNKSMDFADWYGKKNYNFWKRFLKEEG